MYLPEAISTWAFIPYLLLPSEKGFTMFTSKSVSLFILTKNLPSNSGSLFSSSLNKSIVTCSPASKPSVPNQRDSGPKGVSRLTV